MIITRMASCSTGSVEAPWQYRSVHYDFGGRRHAAPPVVLLHGLGSSSRDWLFQRPAFESAYPVLMVDLPGHGRSPRAARPLSVHGMAEDVARVLTKEALPASHVIGVSLGACVALALALQAPQRVRSLTLINGFARLRPAGVAGGARMLVRLALLATVPMRLVAWHVARATFPRADHADLRQLAVDSLRRTSRRSYIAAIGALLAYDVRGHLGRVQCPTLVVTGGADRTVPSSAARALAGGIPGARLLTVPGSGHAPHCDAPGVVNAAVLEFLAAI
jgi:pimeloyl-ACP methyl ester carboxylesterase